MNPINIDFVCKNCLTNINDNWWWCPICGNNVSILEVPVYSKYQRLILKIQNLFCCTNSPVDLDTLINSDSDSSENILDREIDEVDTNISRNPPTEIRQVSYV